MDNKLEKRMLQNDINQTPKTVLEELFTRTEEKRISYEEQIPFYKQQIEHFKNRIKMVEKVLKHPKKYDVQDLNVHIEYKEILENNIREYKREIRLISINCSILWKNVLKMDKVLGYGLEE